VCATCGAAAFPPRVICPRCGSIEWNATEARQGTVEAATENSGVRVATVRTDQGPLLIARLTCEAKIGAIVVLTQAHDGSTDQRPAVTATCKDGFDV
jgi:uncharacterized OB-fold protein